MILDMTSILLIDDNKTNIVLLEKILTVNFPGIEFLAETTSTEGIKTAKIKKPDTILLDIQIPDMNGFEACKILKATKETKHIPVLFITAVHDNSESKIRGLEMGADGFISKPFIIGELVAQVKVMLRIKKAEDELREKNIHLEEIVEKRTKELEESEKRYKSIFQNNNSVMLLINPENGVLIDANPATCNFYGYSYEELLKKNLLDIVYSAKRTLVDERDILLSFRQNHYFSMHQLANGLVREVEIYSGEVPVTGETKRLCIVHDITQRREVEKKIKESEELYRLLFTHINNGFAIQEIIFDENNEPVNYTIAQTNRTYESITGLIDAKGQTITKAMKTKKPLWLEHYKKVVKTGKSVSFSEYCGYFEKYLQVSIYKPQKGKTATLISDITNKIKAEKGLLQEKAYFEQLFNNAPEAIVVTDNSHTIQRINNAFKDIFGYNEDVLGKNINTLLASHDLLAEANNISAKVEVGHTILRETKRKTSDGNWLDVSILGAPIIVQGEQVGIFGIYRDITDRKKAEKKLFEQYQFTKTLINAIPHPIFYKDTKGKYLGCNKAFQYFIGLKEHDIIGKTIHEITPSAYADVYQVKDRELLENPYENQTYEYKVQHADGTPHDIIFSKAAFRKINGDIGGLVGVMIDITEKIQIEKDLRHALNFVNILIEKSPVGIMVFEIDGQCIMANNSASGILGAPSKEELLNENFRRSEIWKKSDILSLAIESIDTWNPGRKIFNSVTVYGKKVWLDAYFVPVTMQQKKQLMVMFRDITEMKENEIKIKQNLENQKLLSDIAFELNKIDDFGKSIREVFSYIGNFTKISHIKLFEIDLSYNTAKPIVSWCKNSPGKSHAHSKIEFTNTNALIKLFKDEGSIDAEKVKELPQVVKNQLDKHVKSVLMFPLNVFNKVFGFIVFDEFEYYRKWDDILKEILKTVSHIISNSYERKIIGDNLRSSEERFRQLSENIDDVVILLQHANIIYMNPAFEKLTGMQRKNVYNDTNLITTIIHPDDKTVLDEFIDDDNIYHFPFNRELRIKLPSGEKKYLWLRAFPISDQQGSVYRSVVIASDITERKEMEVQIMQTIIQTEEKEKKRFSEDLHDGLGPLLSSIKLYLNLLKSKSKSGKSKDEIIKVVKFIEELSDEAIANAKTIANDLTPNILNDYGLEQAVSNFCNNLDNSGLIKIYYLINLNGKRLDNSLEMNVYRIIKELINNTLKHAEAKQIELNINLKENKLLIQFKDDGKGCKMDDVLSKNHAGLGIRNIYNRVRSMKGHIDLKTKPGRGMEVNIHYPVE